MAVRELGEHDFIVTFSGKTWRLIPPLPDDDSPAVAMPVVMEHRVDRHETRVKRLNAGIAELRPRVKAAREAATSASNSKRAAEQLLKDAWLFKGDERARLRKATREFDDADSTLSSLLSQWNPLIAELKRLESDAARYVTKRRENAWSQHGRIYRITHSHPSVSEATLLIDQFRAKKARDLMLMERQLSVATAQKHDEQPGVGCVNVLLNPTFPNMVKIGGTSRTAEERALELSTTGVATPFVVVYSLAVRDWREAESRLHSTFAQYRVNGKREFFALEPTRVIDEIQWVARELEAAYLLSKGET